MNEHRASGPRRFGGALLAAALLPVAALSLLPSPAHAFEPFALQIPCRATAENDVGTVRPCITCHNNADGGGGCPTPPCQNAFGMAFDANGRMWNETLALLDSDGDGFTNGEELGDPTGTWRPGNPTPGTCDCATRPGFASFTPGNDDPDGDGYCCRGVDNDSNGDCLGAGEHDGPEFDCDEGDDAVNSGAAEMCTNPVDNDCDGLPTLMDDDCASVVDRDGDGYCPMGIDNNNDRDCIDAGEDTADVDCDDDEVTVSPAAREFCVDLLDNDCDGDIDTADSECTSDVDADDDGYCPIGRDINDDGDCNDAGEIDAGFDCDDSLADVNPDAPELCTDFRDNDCDGLADFRDTEDCGAFFDADMDGYCPGGRDGDGDGNCTGAGETDDPGDCDDTDPTINPGMMEVCTNGDVDNDCDGVVPSLADPDCAGWIDTDGDSYCFVGVDSDIDGFCVTDGEATGEGDCDETSSAVRPGAVENCTDGIDNDCDGSTDSSDRGQCDDYRDRDHDGWCLVGEDLNDDGDCSDAGEQGDPHEWAPGEVPGDPGTEDDPTRYPGAPEHCGNRVDEDLDGEVDEAASCTRDTDADGDGYCAIGVDLNGDGDCLDDGENDAVYDCNDGDAEINPGQEERCLEFVDADCDGEWGVDDSDCFIRLDRDGDTYCGVGVDDNGDRDCLDEGEDRFGADCDDFDAAVNQRAREVCDDEIDNDCDGDVDIADSQCDCEMDAQCDDSDPCTLDVCGADGECTSSPDPMCMDGGVAADAGMEEPDPGCGCRVGGERRSPLPFALLAVAALLFSRRRR